MEHPSEGAEMRNEIDSGLQALFEEKSRGLPEEPFLSNVLKIIERKRRRRIVMRRLAYAIVLVVCALLSPLLVRGSMVLSSGLNAAFNAVNGFVDTPAGMFTAGLLALLYLFFRKGSISRTV
jgi:hypothetical protein